MGKFSLAFDLGQEAAQSAALANSEIDKIIHEMTEEISSITGGKLVISVEKPATLHGLLYMTTKLFSTEPDVGSSENLFICANNPTSAISNLVKLAQFERPYEGYPCQIQYGKNNVRCNDGVALAAALNEMLANAWVAHQLRDVMNRLPKQETNAASGNSGTE